METKSDIVTLSKKIKTVRNAILEMKTTGQGIPALEKNAARMLASLKMLEINCCDVVGLEE